MTSLDLDFDRFSNSRIVLSPLCVSPANPASARPFCIGNTFGAYSRSRRLMLPPVIAVSATIQILPSGCFFATNNVIKSLDVVRAGRIAASRAHPLNFAHPTVLVAWANAALAWTPRQPHDGHGRNAVAAVPTLRGIPSSAASRGKTRDWFRAFHRSKAYPALPDIPRRFNQGIGPHPGPPPYHRASGSGRIWNFTTLGVVPFPVSMWNGVRLPFVVHRPRPFHPALGSSMRPSIHLA